jgi:hypothetical protein
VTAVETLCWSHGTEYALSSVDFGCDKIGLLDCGFWFCEGQPAQVPDWSPGEVIFVGFACFSDKIVKKEMHTRASRDWRPYSKSGASLLSSSPVQVWILALELNMALELNDIILF